MIVITDIKYHQVADPDRASPWNVHGLPDLINTQWSGHPGDESDLESADFVRGVEFKNPATGESILIGNTNTVSDLIGIQFETFENLENAHKNLSSDYRRVSKKSRQLISFVDKVSDASFLTRLKWLFTGCKL